VCVYRVNDWRKVQLRILPNLPNVRRYPRMWWDCVSLQLYIFIQQTTIRSIPFHIKWAWE
jgi:hypothetical protein